jgi:DNA invertase Pin-like site-specific DNA recombinase
MNLLPPPSTLPPGAIVDSYRRDSGGPKQDKSTAQQLRIIEEFCKKHGLVHRHRFVDQAKSGGSTVGRDDFERMIELYSHPEQRPQGLILWSYARFAREVEDATFYKAYIRVKKIAIHSLIDNVPEGKYGRIVELFIDMGNEEKREQVSAEAKRGLQDLFLVHHCVPGVPPRGFNRVPVDLGSRADGSRHVAHRWVPDPKLKAKVRTAFKMLAAGATLKEIHSATRLYGAINSYKTFFTNRIYIGVMKFGDVVDENYCKPIVDMNTWNKVQKIIHDRAQLPLKQRHPRRANSVYLLSGFAKCAGCGSPLNGNTVTRHDIHWRNEAYRCARATQKNGCKAGRIPRERLETSVLEVLINEVLQPDALSAHQEIAHALKAEGEARRSARLVELKAENAELSRQIANLSKAIAEMGGSPTLQDALKEKELHRAHTRTELKELEIPIQPVTALSPPELSALSKKLIHALTHAPLEDRRLLLRGILVNVFVERADQTIRGVVEYSYPFDLPMGGAPVGAQLYRQRFTLPFETKARS